MSAVSPVSVNNEREIQPMDLSIEQLNNLKQQHEEEIRELQRQLEQLSGAKNRFLMAKSSLDDLAASAPENRMLIPLNQSLYVPGTLHSNNKVIVELGTGYFCEKTVDDAKDMIDRKLQLVGKSMESIEQVGGGKARTLDMLIQVMNYKMSMAQQQQA